ncbi:MAG: 6-phosphogluconolactonase [Gammaproteobacteria bacterium]|nr:6-phosphogluconolactonase [Gammaproteobacteria bacterium]
MPGATKPEAPAPRLVRAADAQAQAAVLAGAIASELRHALARRAAASLVVSGGRTPAAMLAQLARQDLDWTRVQLTLADERWVDADDAASNEALVRASLLRERAAAARLIGMKNSAPTPVAGADAAWRAIDAMPRPFDVIILGMGDDGHTASLFPGSVGLAAALDPDAPPCCVAMQAPAAPRERLSLNLAALLRARRICIQISGARKWQVYQRALAAGPAEEMPVRALLRQQSVPVDVYWCPDGAPAALP